MSSWFLKKLTHDLFILKINISIVQDVPIINSDAKIIRKLNYNVFLEMFKLLVKLKFILKSDINIIPHP
jgi:hypothetical protein